MTGRRDLLTIAALAMVPGLACATGSPARVALIGSYNILPGETESISQIVEQGFRAQGMLKGRDYVLDERYLERGYEKAEAVIKEVIALKADLILSFNSQVTLLAKRLTTTIPIVFVNSPNPVGLGLVSNLSHPGGNVTGISTGGDLTSDKQVELMAAIVPNLKRLALMLDAKNRWSDIEASYRPAADRHGIKLIPMNVVSLTEIENAFHTMQKERVQGVILVTDAFFFSHRNAIAQLSLNAGIPVAARARPYAEAGVLFSYGAASGMMGWRTAIDYAVRILHGIKPGDLPVQQPMEIKFVLNRTTARKLKLALPAAVLVRADEVIE